MKASILINNYNYAPYLDRAIQSCLNQTYSDIEIIVYDDGSKDDSVNIMKSYAERITIIANANHGKGHCWNQINSINKAFDVSTGDIIFLLDSDDWFSDEKVSRVTELFRSRPDAICVQHKFQLVDEDGETLNTPKRPFFSDVDIIDAIYHTGRMDFFFTQTSGLCFRRSFLNKVLPIQEDDLSLICVDIRLSRYAAFEGPVVTVQEKLAYYRIHTKNHSSNLKDADYYKRYDIQHTEFFNRLAMKYGKPYLKFNPGITSYFKVLITLFRSTMSLSEKYTFIKDWANSYMKK